MAAYRDSFGFRNLTERYLKTEFRRLEDVFRWVMIADPKLPSVRRTVDTFDLTNPHWAGRIREACWRDLPSKERARACLKAIDRYCRYLRECPTIHLPGQKSLYLPELYGPIESPVNQYTLPRNKPDRTPNRNFLEESEYKTWLRFTWSRIHAGLSPRQLLKATQLHVMCVVAGESGLRLQEILGLQPEHINLKDGQLLVTRGKGSNGSGHRKRSVPISALLKATLEEFFRRFPRRKGEPVFQTSHGQRLSASTAHHWMDELIAEIQKAGLPILIEKGFGWHAFRRTYTRLYLEREGNVFDLKRNTGWTWTSTISHYLGDSKQMACPGGPPLMAGRVSPRPLLPSPGGGHGG
ncbi:MAG: tyrosine-type recombinase/integrase [Candidatus Melainabacteria bacterium]